MHKSVIGFIGVGVILLLMSMMMTAVKGSTTAPRTDSFSVTTGGGETTAIIGTQEFPWKGLTSSVETISSSQPTLDFPLCSFVSGNEVTVSGLDASQTRVLTVTYLYDSNQGFMGASQMATIVPLLLWVGIICLVIGLGMAVFKKG